MYYALTLLLSHHDCLIAVCQHNPHGRGFGAGWSSPVARQAHNLKVAGSNPAPATNFFTYLQLTSRLAFEAAFLRFSAKPIRQLGAFVALP
jgi:hypothetical protein